VGIQMPAAWDAAGVSFAALTRSTGGAVPTDTFGKVVDDAGAEVTLAAAAADMYVNTPSSNKTQLQAPGRLKIRSGTAASPVNQTATRVIGIVTLED
jgi:hypothetical protein